MSKLLKVFVYGTLKRGEPNHHVLSSKENGFSEFQSEGKTAQKYPLVIGDNLFISEKKQINSVWIVVEEIVKSM